MQGEAAKTFTKRKTLAYEVSDYFSRFVSYLVDLVIILSIVTLILVYAYNEPPIVYLFPYFYLYTHNSIHNLVLNSNGVDFLISYLLISFIYYFVSSYFAHSPGGLILNLRTKNVTYTHKGGDKMPYKKRFFLKLKCSSLRSLFLTIPFFPFFDNIFGKEGMKLTDRYLKTVVVHPLHLKKIKIVTLFNRNRGRKISKISPKMISYPEFLEYYGLEETDEGLRINNRKKKADPARGRFRYSSRINEVLEKINSVVNLNEFFLNELVEKGVKDPEVKTYSIWKVTKKNRLRYFYASSLLYFVPFIVAILIGWHTTNNLTFYVPPPLISNRYVPIGGLSQVQQGIFNLNFSFDLKFLVLGGITLFFLPYLGIYSSVYLPNVEIAGTLHTQYWYYIFYALFPHLFAESFAYVLGIISGLYLSKLLIDIVNSYFRGVDFNEFLRLVYFNLSRFVIMFAASFVLLLAASYVEAYVTSYVLNHFYFIQ